MAQSTHGGGTAGNYSGTSVRDLKETARDKAENMTQRLEGAAESLAEQGREVKENVQVVADNLRGAVEKSVRDQPMTTLVAAVALGFIVGALWKS